MSEEGGKSRGASPAGVAAPGEPVNPQHYYYGTFQGVANYQPVPPPPPSQPVIGFPQPVPPPGSSVTVASPHYYQHGYQAFPGILIIL